MTASRDACVFCEIAAGRGEAHRIAENDHALAILDIQPFSPGHTLVLSRRRTSVRGDVLDRHFDELEKKQETSGELAALRRKESREAAVRRIRGR